MRKLLLASAAMLGATSGIASAQTPSMAFQPSQGMMVGPSAANATDNTSNNANGQPSSFQGYSNTFFGAIPPPQPGTVVIRLNGKVEVDMTAFYGSGNNFTTSDGKQYKLNPVTFGSFMRLYPAVDGMATNGLRYGAAIELRENFMSANTYTVNGAQVAVGSGASAHTLATTYPAAGITPSANTVGYAAASPSGNSSAQTVFVRRAFTYLAADNLGVVRFGQTDGVIGLFDPCIFSAACWDAGIGNFNGGTLQSMSPGGVVGIPFAWLAQAGAEYGNTKIVYLSPQFLGFDVGVQYAPNMGNGYTNGVTGSPLQATTCNAPGISVSGIAGPVSSTSGCISASTGSDPTRWLNQVGVGARWQGTFGPVQAGVYAFYETAGKESYNSVYITPSPTDSTSTGQLRYKYDNLSFLSAAAYGTLDTGVGKVTASIDYIGGRLNGQLAMVPTGGVPEHAVVTGLLYKNGPLTLGVEAALVESQGAAQLTHVSQRHEFEVAFGGNYNIAPGMYLVGEYLYTQRHQGGFDFLANGANAGVAAATSGASAPGKNNDVHGQGFLFSTVVNW